MTRPTDDELARALLGTFSHDEVPAQSRARAFAAFGVTTGVATVSTAAIGALAEGANVVAPAATIAAKSAVAVGGFSVVKAAIAGAAIGLAVMHAGEPAPPTLPPLPSVEGASGPADVDPAPAIARAVHAPPVPVEASRVRAPSRALAARPIATHPGADVASASEVSSATEFAPLPSKEERPLVTLTDEVVRLDRARAALREGSPSRATWELDRYDADFANGSLRQEATVLRIELLVETGNAVRANTLAEAFVTAHPRSGYLSKIRELLVRRSKTSAP